MGYPEHTELPFHGKRHPYQVAEDSTRFVKRIESEGRTVNKDALYVASLLHEEQQLVTGTPSSFSTFVKGAINYLGLYAFREIDASQWARLPNGASEWHVGFVQNAITLYMEHNEGNARWQIVDGGRNERNSILDAVRDSETMYVIHLEGEEDRENLLFEINVKKREWKLTSPVLVVPPSYGLKVEPMVQD